VLRDVRIVKTYWAEILIAGDLAKLEDSIREWCMRGACVSVTPTNFIYTGGAQSGACVRLISYPRYPKSPEEIWLLAVDLGKFLMNKAYQKSCTIHAADKTELLEAR